MKIYIVTAGQYSDYRIEKIFTDKTKAEEFAKWFYDSNGVEEWDTEDEFEVEKYYSICVQYKICDNCSCETPIVCVSNCTNNNHTPNITYLADYHTYGLDYIVLNISRTVKANNDNETFYKEKYTKVAYDTMAMIKQLHVEGYSYNQINEMLRNNAIEVF